MNIEVSQVDTALTGNGTAQGQLTVASTTGFTPGAVCQLYDTLGHSATVQITSVPDATHVNVRLYAQPGGYPMATGAGIFPAGAGTSGPSIWGQSSTENLPPNYGTSDISLFTTVNGARICQNKQSVRVEPQSQVVNLT